MSNIVQSVERALSIMELLSEHNEGLGITEIGEKTDLHKSTVHRLLATLIHKGFVEQSEVTNNYRNSLRIYEIGSRRVANLDILSVSKPFTEKLMKDLNEVVHLVVSDEECIVYIDKVEANNTIQMSSTIGKRSPAYSTSVGKAILAFSNVEEVSKVWQTSDLKKYTSNTIVDYEEFKKELNKINKLGYAEDDEENEIGLRCIGAPIFGITGRVEGAISISGPSSRVTKEKVEEIGKKVKGCAREISKELGYISLND